jgi:ABC-type nitrate/sulfonate/bicarbonate transport system substrate-binding protein
MKHLSRMLIFVVIGAVVAAGCGDDDDDDDSGGSGAGQSVHLVGSSTGHAYIGQFHAADIFGKDFGLGDDNKVTSFEDESAATQVLLSGRADVQSAAVTQLIQLILKDQDIKAFCPVQIDSTEHLVGLKDKITSLDQITDPNIRVAVDSPGGLVNFIMNLVFKEKGLGITVNDLENVTILGDGSQRLAALAAKEVDVGSVDLFELPDLQKQIVTAEDADFIANVYSAPTKWLDENTDLAGRYCAATLYANRVLASDYDEYDAAIQEYLEGGVDEEIVKTNWEFARKYEVWPYNADVVSPEGIKTIIDVGIESGLLEEAARDLKFEDIVDTRPMDIAMDLVGGPVDASDVNAGNVPAPKEGEGS